MSVSIPANGITYKVVGDFLIKRERYADTYIFSAYKRIYGAQFKTKYAEVKQHQGQRYGKMGTEKISLINNAVVNKSLTELRNKINKAAFNAIEKAYPEAAEGLHQSGTIVL